MNQNLIFPTVFLITISALFAYVVRLIIKNPEVNTSQLREPSKIFKKGFKSKTHKITAYYFFRIVKYTRIDKGNVTRHIYFIKSIRGYYVKIKDRTEIYTPKIPTLKNDSK